MSSFEKGSRDLRRLCVHTITTKPWSIETAIEKYHAAGIGGISVWRDTLEGRNLDTIKSDITGADLSAVSLVRGGFFTGTDETTRQEAVTENKKAIDECAAIGAPMVVLVVGATPGLTMAENLSQVQSGIEACIDHASACGVKLAIEPLHPMYADTRSAVTTMKVANDMCDAIGSDTVGVAADVFHIWWDPDMDAEIARCGASGNLLAYHICDWKPDMEDMLFDRGLMGEGIIDLKRLSGLIDDAGFDGFYEVEVFSNKWWAEDQDAYLAEIIKAYQSTC